MKKISTLALIAALGLGASAAYAQNPPANADIPGHPRVDEVNQRLDNQQNRINQGEANGTMTQGQAAADEKRDARIAKQESADEAKHNGHLTKGEQRKLNKEENHNSKDIHKQKEHGEKRKDRREERKERREHRRDEHKDHREGQ